MEKCDDGWCVIGVHPGERNQYGDVAFLIYERDNKLIEMYGGVKFDYCPMCGNKLKSPTSKDGA